MMKIERYGNSESRQSQRRSAKNENFGDFWVGIWEDNTNTPLITINANKLYKTIMKNILSARGIDGTHNFIIKLFVVKEI